MPKYCVLAARVLDPLYRFSALLVGKDLQRTLFVVPKDPRMTTAEFGACRCSAPFLFMDAIRGWMQGLSDPESQEPILLWVKSLDLLTVMQDRSAPSPPAETLLVCLKDPGLLISVLFTVTGVAVILVWRRVKDRRVQVIAANEQLTQEIRGRKQAEDALQRQGKLLKIVHEIGRSILEARSPAATVQEVLRMTVELVPCCRATITVFDFEANKARLICCPIDECMVGEEKHLTLEPFKSAIEVLQKSEMIVAGKVSDLVLKADMFGAFSIMGAYPFVGVPLTFHGKLMGSFDLWNDIPIVLSQEHRDILRVLANLLAVVVQNGRLVSSIKEQNDELRSFMIRLADVEESEKRRLARELHDNAGQCLTALNLNLSVLGCLLPPGLNAAVGQRLEEAQSLVKEAAGCIRDLMVDLRPPDLDEYGLQAALEWYAEKYSERTLIATVVQCQEPFPRLLPSVEVALFRIAQEALTNVIRHARATSVVITLAVRPRGARMVIRDDGEGFDLELFRRPGKRSPGWGLMGMRERAEAASGSLLIESSAGKGTSIIVETRG